MTNKCDVCLGHLRDAQVGIFHLERTLGTIQNRIQEILKDGVPGAVDAQLCNDLFQTTHSIAAHINTANGAALVHEPKVTEMKVCQKTS